VIRKTWERDMKNLKRQPRLTVLLLSTLCSLTGAYGQIAPSGGAYPNTASTARNFAKPLLDVESAAQNPFTGPHQAQRSSQVEVAGTEVLPVLRLGTIGAGGLPVHGLMALPKGVMPGSQARLGRRELPAPGTASNSIFLAAPSYDSSGFEARSVAVADVNGDGKPDLVVANFCANSSNCANGGEVSVSLGNGDGTFQPAVSYGSGGYEAYFVTVGDVNGDGKPDLLVTHQCLRIDACTQGVVGVLLGNGDGTFQAAASYGSGGYDASSVAVADVNGDGLPDLVVTNQCASATNCLHGSIGLLLGNGDGTFQRAVIHASSGEFTYSVAVVDVNGDGKPDMLVSNLCASSSNCANGTVDVWLGNGYGTFIEPVSYSSGGYAGASIAVADVNGDGKLDILVTNQCASSSNCTNGTVGVLLGNGDGTFQQAVTYGSGGYVGASIVVLDVNGDGKPDLLVANVCASIGNCTNSGIGDGSVGVLLGNGDGTFQTAVSYSSGGQSSLSVAAGDVNGDGKPDLLVTNLCAGTSYCGNGIVRDGSVGVLLGNGDGTFQAAESYDSGGYESYSLAVGDVNGDGKPDLLVADVCASSSNCANGVVKVMLGKGDGTFQAAGTYGSGGYEAGSIAVADVNGDGNPDLVLANFCADSNNCVSGVVSVMLGNGDGTFQAAVTYGSGGWGAYSVAVADVNGDGKPDLLVTNDCADDSGNCTIGTVGVLLGNGDGTFRAAVSYGSAGSGFSSIAVGDVNRDGKPDLLVANQCGSSSNCANGGSVGVLLGNGDGTFQAAVSYGSGGYGAASVAVGDINRDGKPDLAVANYCATSSNCANGGVISVMLGNGDGTFQPAVSITTLGNNTGAIVLADFNGDGKLDIASGAGDALLLGNGDGTFQAPLDLGASGQGITIGDFNHDGRPDLAVGGMIVLLNISPFSSTMTIASTSNPSVFGQGVVFLATVTPQGPGSPTGSVTFNDGSTLLCTSPLSGGMAKCQSSTLAIGPHSISAVYSGDSHFKGSSASLSQTVNQANTTLGLSSSVNPSGLDQPVTFTAAITPQYSGQASGIVTFKDGTTTLGSAALSGNVASWTASGLAMGTHSITAIYAGDSNFTGSVSNTLSQVVTRATTTTSLVSSTNPSVSGKPVTFTAVVSSPAGTPSGKVRYVNGTTVLSVLTLTSGSAKYTTAKLPPGSNRITAVYEGDSNNSGSTSAPVNQFVLAATTTTLTSSPNPSTHGEAVTFTAVVTSSLGAPPNGETVTFKKGTTVLGTGTLSGGAASFTTSALPVGTNYVKAAYGGDSNLGGSTSKVVKQVVN
jgi:hypothetical protein